MKWSMKRGVKVSVKSDGTVGMYRESEELSPFVQKIVCVCL